MLSFNSLNYSGVLDFYHQVIYLDLFIFIMIWQQNSPYERGIIINICMHACMYLSDIPNDTPC